jgi:hypothetical protein
LLLFFEGPKLPYSPGTDKGTPSALQPVNRSLALLAVEGHGVKLFIGKCIVFMKVPQFFMQGRES